MGGTDVNVLVAVKSLGWGGAGSGGLGQQLSGSVAVLIEQCSLSCRAYEHQGLLCVRSEE